MSEKNLNGPPIDADGVNTFRLWVEPEERRFIELWRQGGAEAALEYLDRLMGIEPKPKVPCRVLTFQQREREAL